MNKMPTVLSSIATVRFQDCDPYGHLNNSNYISYFLNHREDEVKDKYDFDLFKLGRETGKIWLVAQNQIAYFAPANLMEQVTIESQLIGLRNKVLHVEMRMFSLDRSHLKALLWSKFVHFDVKKNISIAHDDSYQALFENVLQTISVKSFDERVSQIKQMV